MKLITAPKYVSSIPETSLFLGGGITNCKDWQSKVIDDLADEDLIIFNPRREKFDSDDKNCMDEQINWEHTYLRRTNFVMFYFCEETLCPITLLELGATLERSIYRLTYQQIFIYCEPNYKWLENVKIQTKLVVDDFYKQEDSSTVPFFAEVFDTYDLLLKKLKNEIRR